jgi:DNA modification methylase
MTDSTKWPAFNVERKATAELVPYARNSRTHSDEQVSQIAASIKEWGFTTPILIDEDNGIIAGHGRLMAAQRLGLSEVPCIVATNWTDAQKRAYVIADNKLALNAGWDNDMLAVEFGELKDLDFDLSLTGFDNAEIDALFPDEVKSGLTDEDAVPEAPEQPVTVESDVWVLGKHRLMCGDSTSIDAVKKLMNGQEPNTMLTDPPYGVKYEADWRAKAKDRKKTEREESSNLKNDDQADWYDAYVLFEGAVAYVWHASAFTDVVMDGLRRAGFEVKQQIIWNKNVHALSRSDFHWKHEPCWYAVKPNKNRNWRGGRSQMTVWDIKSVIFEDGKTAHPTQKPVEIYRRPLEFHTNEGEYVYDPFGGSGTLIIACEELNRRALTMELDPKYCDVIIKRWQDFTGQEATLESTGETYKQLKDTRCSPAA